MSTIANKSDFGRVAVYFEDAAITELFAELLISLGVEVAVINDLKASTSETKIITEPRYFSQLSESLKKHCLLVGNKGSLEGFNAQTLSRPLTEEKVEIALEKFLQTEHIVWSL